MEIVVRYEVIRVLGTSREPVVSRAELAQFVEFMRQWLVQGDDTAAPTCAAAPAAQLLPPAQPSRRPVGARAQDFAERALEGVGQPFTIRDFANRMAVFGWKPTTTNPRNIINAARAALKALPGDLEPAGENLWRFTPAPQPAASDNQ
jgi:hypothetical protein